MRWCAPMTAARLSASAGLELLASDWRERGSATSTTRDGEALAQRGSARGDRADAWLVWTGRAAWPMLALSCRDTRERSAVRLAHDAAIGVPAWRGAHGRGRRWLARWRRIAGAPLVHHRVHARLAPLTRRYQSIQNGLESVSSRQGSLDTSETTYPTS